MPRDGRRAGTDRRGARPSASWGKATRSATLPGEIWPSLPAWPRARAPLRVAISSTSRSPRPWISCASRISERISSALLLARLSVPRQTLMPQLAQRLQRKRRVAEIGVAFRAMDDRGAGLRDQLVIVILEIIEMGDDAVGADDAVLDQVRQRRALPAIGVVAAQARQEIVERPARVGKHLVLLDRLGDVGGGEHAVLFAAGAGQAVEIDRGGVGRVGRKAEAAEPLGMLLEKAQRAEQRLVLVDPRANVDQLQEPPGAQRRHGQMRQQFGKRLDVGHGGDAALRPAAESPPRSTR